MYNGSEIKSEKGKKLPSRFFKAECIDEYGELTTNVRYALKSQYKIGVIKKGKRLINVLITESGEPVLANPRAAGTPKYMPINGQAIYNGKVAQFSRAKMMTEIKRYFATELVENNKAPFAYLKAIAEDLNTSFHMEMHLHDHIENGNWDLGNRLLPYEKAFPDLLCTGKIDKDTKVFEPILKDDNIKFINGISKFYHELEDSKEPYLIIKFIISKLNSHEENSV